MIGWELQLPLDTTISFWENRFFGFSLKDDGKTEIRAISAQPERGGRRRARGGRRMRETGRHDGGDGRASPPRGARRPQWRCQGNGAPRHRAKKGSGGDRAVQERRERGYKRQRAQGRHQP